MWLHYNAFFILEHFLGTKVDIKFYFFIFSTRFSGQFSGKFSIKFSVGFSNMTFNTRFSIEFSYRFSTNYMCKVILLTPEFQLKGTLLWITLNYLGINLKENQSNEIISMLQEYL